MRKPDLSRVYTRCLFVSLSREVKKLYWGINSRPRDTITLKYYGNEKLSPTRAMFASFSAKDNATTGEKGLDVESLRVGRIYGTLFCKWTFLVRGRYREFKAR